jgi:DNA-binding transcriptional ArsR family regulator
VRLRIVHALSAGRARTTSELSARLPDVSKATLYRQVSLLAEAGLLEVAGEERVHGAVERCYRLNKERARIDAAAAKSMSREDHRSGFAAAVAGLVAEFNAYLDRDDADPTADLVGYRQIPVWLTRKELAQLIERVSSAMGSNRDNRPGRGRRLYLMSPIIFPIEPPADSDE